MPRQMLAAIRLSRACQGLPRHEHDGADQRFEWDVVVQEESQPQPKAELPDRRHGRVEQRVGDREPEYAVVP